MLNGPVPLYCTDEVEEVIRQAFSYAFHPAARTCPPGCCPSWSSAASTSEPFEVLGERSRRSRCIHGQFNVFGFRIGDVAYCTDVSEIPERSWPLLEGLDVLVIDALRLQAAPGPLQRRTRRCEVIERVKPRAGVPDAHVAHDGLRRC